MKAGKNSKQKKRDDYEDGDLEMFYKLKKEKKERQIRKLRKNEALRNKRAEDQN